MAADGRAEAIGGTFDDGLAVDRSQDGTPHPHVVERLLFAVDRQDGFGPRAAQDHLELRVVLELRDDARGGPWERIDIAGQQRCGHGSRIGDEAEGELPDFCRARIAEAIPFDQRQRRALAPVFQLVRTGADGLRRVGIGALGLDDDCRGLAQDEQQVGIDFLVDDHHRELVHGLGAEVGEDALVFVGAFLTAGPVEAELDGLRVEGLTVLELDAPVKLEGVGLEVGRDFEALRQQRRDAAIGIDPGQCLEHVVLNDFSDRGRRAGGRVQSWWFQRHAQHHGIFAPLGQRQRG